MSFELTKKINYFEIFITGESDSRDYSQIVNSLLDHEEWRTHTPILINHSAFPSAPVTKEKIESFARTCALSYEKFGSPKVAIVEAVATKICKYEKIKFWDKFAERRMDVGVNIFNSTEKAIYWLVENPKKRKRKARMNKRWNSQFEEDVMAGGTH